jgi:hypothetical protein
VKEQFAPSLVRELVYEGGRVDDSLDPGGRTNQGVTQRVYSAWRVRQGLPPRDVWLMVPAERDAIYRTQYWTPIKGDELPAGVDFALFDGAVNSGPVQAVKWLQRALGGLRVDGQMGQATLAAVLACPDHDRLIGAMLDRRLAFLQALRGWGRYGGGWRSRVTQVRRHAQALASGSVGPDAVYSPGGERKGLLEDARRAPARGFASAATGGGVVAVTLSQTTAALTPLADHVAAIGATVAWLTAAGGMIAVGAMLYDQWARRRAAALADALDVPDLAGRDPAPGPAPAPAPDLPEASP